jgi:membrane protein implicated in regulation of membrane protease activity
MARVTSAITSQSGQVKIEGEEWEARPAGANSGIDNGMTVLVKAYRGNILLVSPHKDGPKIK